MSGLLRQTSSLAGISKSVLRITARQTIRPSLVPTSHQALLRSRHYATNEPEKPNNEEKKAVEPPAKESAKKNAKSAPGMEHLYGGSNSPMSPKASASEASKVSPPPKSILSAEEEQTLQDILAVARKNLPATQAAIFERAAAIMRREGIPEELKPVMARAKPGTIPSLSDAMTIAKFTSRYAKRLAQEDVEAESAGKGKTDFQSNAPKAEKGGEKKTGEKKPDGPFSFNMDMSTTLAGAFVMYLIFEAFSPGGTSKDITWQEFRTTFLDKGLVEKLTVEGGDRVRVDIHRDLLSQTYPDSPATNPAFHYYFSIGSVESFERRLDEAQQELRIPSHERIPVTYAKRSGRFVDFFLSLAPTLLFMGMLFALSRRATGGGGGGSGGIFSMGKSKAKRFNHDAEVKVKFKDVAGMDEAKQEIMEFVAFLKTPEQFQRLGAKIPRGAILSGPPGTGKTLLAKATAGESGVPFFSVSGSEFVEMFVGVGASRVRDLFTTARKNTPCIIFIDEIDAIGKKRSNNNFGGGNDEREATLNQILTEMDGFNTSDQVVVLAGTNRSDVLDSALMRPGRFDRHIAIDRPTMDGRKQIFKVHLGKIVTNEDIGYLTGRLAALTPGFSGADIANCVNEAALIAARTSATSVSQIHFEQAIERVIGGLEKKSTVLNPEEKKVVAYHEAGHAICGWYFKYADPLLKVSIIPRGQGALGYAQYLPASDTYLMNVNQLMDRMAMILGGRVSEELHFETVTSGASDDFNKVTRMATAMVTQWGMSAKLGPLHFPPSDDKFNKPFAESTAQTIDSEVRRIVDDAYKICKNLLTEKKTEIGLVAEELLSKEVLGREDMIRLLGPRPFEDNKEFSKYFGGGISAPLPPPTEADNAPPTDTAPPPQIA